MEIGDLVYHVTTERFKFVIVGILYTNDNDDPTYMLESVDYAGRLERSYATKHQIKSINYQEVNNEITLEKLLASVSLQLENGGGIIDTNKQPLVIKQSDGIYDVSGRINLRKMLKNAFSSIRRKKKYEDLG